MASSSTRSPGPPQGTGEGRGGRAAGPTACAPTPRGVALGGGPRAGFRDGPLPSFPPAWRRPFSRGVPQACPNPFQGHKPLVGNELYIVSDRGIATCLDAKTGTVHWQERLGGNFSASPLFADGRIYLLSEEGLTTVVAPGKTFKQLAANQIGGRALASIGVSQRALYLRSADHLYRIEMRK